MQALMPQKIKRLAILSTALVSIIFATSAHAEITVESLADAPLYLHSRTCGLVLLSDGRAKVLAKDPEAIGELIHAFAMLQDGRPLVDKESARKISRGLMRAPAEVKSAAVEQCNEWLRIRASKPDFDNSEKSKWDWVQQAMLTEKTER